MYIVADPPDYNGGSTITAYMLFMEVDKTGTKGITWLACVTWPSLIDGMPCMLK